MIIQIGEFVILTVKHIFQIGECVILIGMQFEAVDEVKEKEAKLLLGVLLQVSEYVILIGLQFEEVDDEKLKETKKVKMEFKVMVLLLGQTWWSSSRSR